MDLRIINYIEHELRRMGFHTNAEYFPSVKMTIFTIRKDNVWVSAEYCNNKPVLVSNFINDIVTKWKRAYNNPELINYIKDDIAATEWCFNNINRKPRDPFGIKKVIFNPPATIVFWTDGTKTVVKAQNNDLFDYEKGLTMAIAKKAFGNKGNYFEHIKKWTKDQPGIIDCTTAEVIMHDCAEHAYQRLLNALHDKKATKADLGMAMEEAVGYLGQILDD